MRPRQTAQLMLHRLQLQRTLQTADGCNVALETSMDYLAGLTDEKAPYPRHDA